MAQVLTSEETLSNQRKSLHQENTILDSLVYVELLGGMGVFVYGLYNFVFMGTGTFLITGGVLLFLGISHYVKQNQNRDDIQNIEAGRAGENFVTKLLREELPDNCYVINDLDVSDGTKTAQNDHLVVSRAGLFLVETKAYGGSLNGNAEDEKWTQTKDGQTRKLSNPIQQSTYHANILNNFLNQHNFPFDDRDIHEFVAMVNKDCDWSIDGDDSNVDYAWKIPNKITRRLGTDTYDPETLVELLSAFNISPPDELRDT